MKQINYVNHTKIISPIGPITISCTQRGIFSVDLDDGLRLRQREENAECVLCDMRVPFNVREELAAYFAGELETFSLPLDLQGTPFQLAVWYQLLEIPFGETRTYSEIALKLGNEKSSKAVSRAINQNPIFIIVPSHRAVSKNGLGGSPDNLEIKAWLLDFERKWRQQTLEHVALDLFEMIEERLAELGILTISESDAMLVLPENKAENKKDADVKKKPEGKLLRISDYLNK